VRLTADSKNGTIGAIPGRSRFFPGVKESGPVRFLWVLCLAFLLFFILYPLLRVLSAADLESWRRVLGSARLSSALPNTLLLVLLSTFFRYLPVLSTPTR
jgi:ABC-type sulfate transport system permease component